jgi:NAD(P)H-hydrate epimerase
MKTLSRKEVRAVDQRAIEEFGMHGLVLMENAGRRCAEIIHQLAKPGKMVILAGVGNNGGDGFVIARHWDLLRSAKPTILLISCSETTGETRMSPDACSNFEILQRSGFDIQLVEAIDPSLDIEIRMAATIVDAMLGTGARPGLPRVIREAVRIANGSNALRFAIDIPTGLDCDTGELIDSCFRADHTLTFVGPKTGFDIAHGPAYVGNVHIV